jgi:hypothetical protein
MRIPQIARAIRPAQADRVGFTDRKDRGVGIENFPFAVTRGPVKIPPQSALQKAAKFCRLGLDRHLHMLC